MSRKCLLGAVLLAFAGTAAAHDEPVIGSLAGAGIGAAIAGPPGAAVGAVIGAIAGSTYAHETDHHHHERGGNGGHARHHDHVHVAPVTVTTKTQMRKVCRYEPVRTTHVTEKRVIERVAVASR